MAITEEDIEGRDPRNEALDSTKMSCHWWAKGMKGLTRFKADIELKDGEIKKLLTSGAGKIRKDAFQLVAEVAGWKKEKIEHSGNINFVSNVPEPDPLPEEKK